MEKNISLPLKEEDIENLKAISSLLNVSIDYLLDDGEKEITEVLTKERNSII